MKTTKITLVFTAFILISTLSFSQTKAIAAGSQYPPQIPITTFEGKLSIKGMMKGKNIKEKTPVDLFKAFKEGVYKINFNFKTSDVKANQIILFDMKTTVKHNGKTISESSRGGWPWLPGDMFVPIEAFDAIPAWQKYTERGLPVIIPFKGAYEFIFQFVPSEGQKVKGSISPASMKFTIE
jgi:methionine-rich copper-binding protein CopC